MTFKDIEFVIFDVETTGLFPQNGDRIVEIAALKIKDAQTIDTFQSFVNPERDIPEEAAKIHKITNDMVSQAPKASDILPDFIGFVGGACLVGHNIKFDLDFLCYQLSLCGRKLNKATPAIDTLKMTKHLLPQLTRHRLENVAQFFGVTVTETHRALADVKLTVTVFNWLLKKSTQYGIQTPFELLKQFSVEKPTFKIEEMTQESLF